MQGRTEWGLSGELAAFETKPPAARWRARRSHAGAGRCLLIFLPPDPAPSHQRPSAHPQASKASCRRRESPLKVLCVRLGGPLVRCRAPGLHHTVCRRFGHRCIACRRPRSAAAAGLTLPLPPPPAHSRHCHTQSRMQSPHLGCLTPAGGLMPPSRLCPGSHAGSGDGGERQMSCMHG